MVNQRSPDAGTGSEYARGRPPLHETNRSTIGQVSADGEGGGTVNETGTTIVGVAAEDAVVLAADRRASLGGRFVSSKDTRKVEAVHPTGAVALSGAVGHIQQFTRLLRAETRLYENRRDEAPSMDALATLSGNLLRSAPLRVTPLLGGVDDEGAHVYTVDGGGGVLADDYAAGGSGMQLAYGVLEQEYDADCSVGEARSTAARAVENASERDTASGNGLTVATVTDSGVEFDEYETAGEVA
jgi:proteasome beta subunit